MTPIAYAEACELAALNSLSELSRLKEIAEAAKGYFAWTDNFSGMGEKRDRLMTVVAAYFKEAENGKTEKA